METELIYAFSLSETISTISVTYGNFYNCFTNFEQNLDAITVLR